MDRNTRAQLALLQELAQLLDHARIRFWLRGGWALDFHAGRITRDHSDIDLVAHFRQRSRIRKLLEENGYRAQQGALGSVDFSKRRQDVGLAFIWPDEMAPTVTPGQEWLAHRGMRWPEEAFTNRRYTLQGPSCRAMSIESLLQEKESYERYSGRPLRDGWPEAGPAARSPRARGSGAAKRFAAVPFLHSHPAPGPYQPNNMPKMNWPDRS